MIDVHGIGAFGIVPFLSEDVLKQARFGKIKTQAGRVAYLLALGEKAPAPQIKEGIEEARGALKWIVESIKEEEKK
jgi:hypothetical protein